MRNRNKRVWAHLSNDEHERFMGTVKQSGLSMEASIHFLINDLIPKPKPPVDYFVLINELRNIGNSIHLIASWAAAYHIIIAEE